MFPVIWDLGFVEIRSYGLMLAIAFLVGIFIATKRGEKVGIHPDLVMDLSIYILISSIVGSRLFFVISEWSHYQDHLIEIVQVWKGGLAVLGGIILAVITSYLYLRYQQISFLLIADVMVPSLALGQAIGRIGCFLNGCCFGVACHHPWAVHFPAEGGMAGHLFPDIGIHPTQLYMTLYNLLIFAILLFFDKRNKKVGLTFGLYFILHGVARFSVDFWRYYDDSFIFTTIGPWAVTTTQVTSLGFIIFGAILMVVLWRRYGTAIANAENIRE